VCVCVCVAVLGHLTIDRKDVAALERGAEEIYQDAAWIGQVVSYEERLRELGVGLYLTGAREGERGLNRGV